MQGDDAGAVLPGVALLLLKAQHVREAGVYGNDLATSFHLHYLTTLYVSQNLVATMQAVDDMPQPLSQ